MIKIYSNLQPNDTLPVVDSPDINLICGVLELQDWFLERVRDHSLIEKIKKIHQKYNNIDLSLCFLRIQINSRNVDDYFKGFKKGFFELLKNENFYIILEQWDEGWLHSVEQPHYDIIYKTCKKYNISPHRVIFTNGNLYDKKWHKKYCEEKKITDQFTTVPMNKYTEIIKGCTEELIWGHKNYENWLDYQRALSLRSQKNKIFSQFARVPRDHRIYAILELYKKNLFNYGILSFDKIPEEKLENAADNLKLHRDDISTLKKINKKFFPMSPDNLDFDDNPWYDLHTATAQQTCFELVLETWQDYPDYRLFFTEKTYKPIVNCQPFIVYGNKNINHMLKEYGFKLYTELFDYKFDFEDDPLKRYNQIVIQILQLTTKLSKMSTAEKIAWKFSIKDKMLHNLQTLFDTEIFWHELTTCIDNIEVKNDL